MSNTKWFDITPYWENLDEPLLKLYKLIGLILIVIGLGLLINFVPTIKIWFKLLGSISFGVGIQLFINGHKYLNNKKQN